MDKKERKNLLVFGYGLVVIITFIVGRLAMKHHALTNGKIFALTVALILLITTALRVETLRPVYRIWMRGARFIGEIVSFVLLTVIFYIFFAIPGLILKLLRKDLLDEKIDKTIASYWKSCHRQAFDRDGYKNQY